jgi:hypothetical protein
MPAAIAALATSRSATRSRASPGRCRQAAAQGQPAPRLEAISLRQRSKPIIDMLQRCQKAGQPIVWGV